MIKSSYFFLFLSCIFHFIFPQLIWILISYGFSKNEGAIVLSLSMLFAALILPITGQLIDQRKPALPLVGSIFGVLLGLIGFSNIDGIVTGPFGLFIVTVMSLCLVSGTSIIYSATRRLCEGLANQKQLSKAISNVYLVENAGIGISSVISFFFIEKFRNELIFFDALTTVLLGVVVLRLSSKNSGNQPSLKIESLKRLSLNEVLGQSLLNFHLVLIFLGAYSLAFLHLSVVQVYFSHSTVDPQRAISLMFGINTVSVVLWTLFVGRKIDFSKFNLIQLKAFFVGGIFLLWFGYSMGISSSPIWLIVMGHTMWSIGEAILLPLLSFLAISRFRELGPGISVGLRDALVRVSLVLTPLISILGEQKDYWSVMSLISFISVSLLISISKIGSLPNVK